MSDLAGEDEDAGTDCTAETEVDEVKEGHVAGYSTLWLRRWETDGFTEEGIAGHFDWILLEELRRLEGGGWSGGWNTRLSDDFGPIKYAEFKLKGTP